jgi:hypothetical protein
MASMRKRYDGDLEAGEALLPDADDDELKVSKLPAGDAGRNPRVRHAWLLVLGSLLLVTVCNVGAQGLAPTAASALWPSSWEWPARFAAAARAAAAAAAADLRFTTSDALAVAWPPSRRSAPLLSALLALSLLGIYRTFFRTSRSESPSEVEGHTLPRARSAEV